MFGVFEVRRNELDKYCSICETAQKIHVNKVKYSRGYIVEETFQYRIVLLYKSYLPLDISSNNLQYGHYRSLYGVSFGQV